MRTFIPSLRPALAVVVLAAGAAADTIYKTDGRLIEDVTIVRETLQEVTYKAGRKNESVPTDQVLRIEYSGKPKLVDRADVAVQDDEILDAIDDYRTYVEGFLSGNKRERYAWAPAYAASRLVRLEASLGDWKAVVQEADRLIEQFPDSRWLPTAYLAKAKALLMLGKAGEARAAIDALKGLVETKELSRRWGLEAELAGVLVDPTLQGAKRVEELQKVADRAGTEFPTVRNRALARMAELLAEAKDHQRALEVFQRVSEDPKSDEETLAIAYTGLGDCLYQQAASASGDEAKRLFKDALLAYLRVVVLYKDQSAYVPKAMFFAARCFDQLGDEVSKDRAKRLYGAIVRQYPESRWAQEAKGFR